MINKELIEWVEEKIENQKLNIETLTTKPPYDSLVGYHKNELANYRRVLEILKEKGEL